MVSIFKDKSLSKGVGAGYTLFELVMVIVLVGIIFSVTAPLMIEVGRSWQIASKRNNMSESAMVALDRMVREIRQIKDTASVLAASSSVFQFIDANSNNITFNLSGNYLMRNSNQLAANVSALSFTYYDAAGAVIATPTVGASTNIKSIVVDISFSLGGTTLNLESGVAPRRLQ